MAEYKASRTAVLVCQGRAVADGRRAVGRFADPVALQLLDAAERVPVEQVRAGARPRGFGESMEWELLSSTADVMAARTVAIDDAIRAAANPQLVILGAGLDARAWRMTELAGSEVFEVDQPASQQDKRRRLGELKPAAASVRFVAVDFARDSLSDLLEASGHDSNRPTTWVWEGVVPYLTPEQVAATVELVARRCAPGSRFVITYSTPSRAASFGRKALQALLKLARRTDPLEHEPQRSTWRPEQWRDLLGDHGFVITDDQDLLSVAELLGMTVRRADFLRLGHYVVADRN
ncbi:class I SAM-dependent methyltransferase [Nocardia inohanensis]|uniref:class I SAM-dependent methyltransferase n=1 Tax=Nocardia inohanensis TaxID=209246 RepID=UPI00082EF7A2|nr:class I SAM-dependent methyltransferase [Nocardia inohanensis]